MLTVRIDKHPSDGGRPEHIETITIANVSTPDELRSSFHAYGVWRNSRSIQEAPDAIVQHHPESGAAELVHRAITSTRDPDTHITRKV